MEQTKPLKLCQLLEYETIVIQCHNTPDADTLASAWGVLWYLRHKGRDARVVYGAGADGRGVISKPSLLQMLSDLGMEPEPAAALEEAPDLLVLVDCQCGESNAPDFSARAKAVIDHHPVSDPERLPPLRRIQDCGSCSTIVWSMLEEEGLRPGEDLKLATALYYGLYTDTSEFQEAFKSEDKDMMDALRPNHLENMLFHWQSRNLSLEEMKSVGKALAEYRYYPELRLAVIELEGGGGRFADENLLGYAGDLLIRVDGVDVCLAYCEQDTYFKISARTCIRETQADDVVRYVARGLGGGGGHPRKAGGKIQKSLLAEECRRQGLRADGEGVGRLLVERMEAYSADYDIYFSGEACREADLSGLRRFEKRSDIAIGFLPATELETEGTVLTIRSLEGDMVETVRESTILLFGVEGEPYTNKAADFARQYEEAPELRYVFEGEYLPRISQVKIAGEAPKQAPAKLRELVRACRPKPGHTILARPLERWAKVFSTRRAHYLTGQPGDWLVVTPPRKEGEAVKYHIVSQRVFPKLYIPLAERE